MLIKALVLKFNKYDAMESLRIQCRESKPSKRLAEFAVDQCQDSDSPVWNCQLCLEMALLHLQLDHNINIGQEQSKVAADATRSSSSSTSSVRTQDSHGLAVIEDPEILESFRIHRMSLIMSRSNSVLQDLGPEHWC